VEPDAALDNAVVDGISLESVADDEVTTAELDVVGSTKELDELVVVSTELPEVEVV